MKKHCNLRNRDCPKTIKLNGDEAGSTVWDLLCRMSVREHSPNLIDTSSLDPAAHAIFDENRATEIARMHAEGKTTSERFGETMAYNCDNCRNEVRGVLRQLNLVE